MPTPVLFDVDGVFGEFHHHVEFPLADEFAIVYGPNGVGKTKFLQVVNALCKLNSELLYRLPFDSATVTFDNGAVLAVSREKTDYLQYSLTAVETFAEGHTSRPLALWEVPVDAHGRGGSLSDYDEDFTSPSTSTWTRLDDGNFLDRSDGEVLSPDDYYSRYASSTSPVPPTALADFAKSINTTFVDTSRLRSARPPMTARRWRSAAKRGNGDSTIAHYAAELGAMLDDTLSTNARTSQNLDGTFPARLLSPTVEYDSSEDTIRERYAEQNAKRERLASFQLLEDEEEIPLPTEALADLERRVLAIYLSDTERKLSTFDDILAKIELLRDMVDRRFFRKTLSIGPRYGFRLTTSAGEIIEPSELSSGEQHELILLYSLLFKSPEGALVLLDEPELSLHVTWQREFLNDLLRISRLSGVRVLLATHSPQIIGKWRSRTTQLGPSAAMGDEDALARS